MKNVGDMKKGMFINIVLLALMCILAAVNLVYGSVSIPVDQVLTVLAGGTPENVSWQYIVWESRIPQTATAVLCGSSLATAGLLLQTSFRNPLAGPSILGITNGASLGVGVVMFVTGGVISLDSVIDVSVMGLQLALPSVAGFFAVVTGAFLGAMLVIMILLAFSGIIHSNLMLLIVGIMVSYLASSVCSLLNFFANADNIQNYVMWGMGSFSDVSLAQLPLFAGVTFAGLLLALLLVKPLNAMLLGDNYAANLGVNIKRTRQLLLAATGLLTAVSTAFCGPVAFIGLAVPHIARLLTRTSNHSVLLPATMLSGACIALMCNFISVIPENTIIPLNAVTPVFGAPVIIYIMCRANKGKH